MNYNSMHRKVYRLRGPASDQTCYLCERPAQDWAYDHSDAGEVSGAGSDGGSRRYSLDVDRYLPLCRSCHRIVDQPARDVRFLPIAPWPGHLASLSPYRPAADPGAIKVRESPGARGDRAERPPGQADSKRCRDCEAVRPASEFSTDRSKRDGLGTYCRPCDRRRARERHASQSYERSFYDLTRADLVAERYREDRARAIEIYGGECARCGSVDRLEFDHVNHDGLDHRKAESSSVAIRRIARSGAPLADWGLRLLCAKCHRVGINCRRPWSDQRSIVEAS